MSETLTNLLSQFTDDTALFFEYNKISLEQALETFGVLEANTGLKISYDKTTVYWVGSLAYSDAIIYTQKKLKWSQEDFTILGIVISNVNCARKNYEIVINKMQSVCQQWQSRAKMSTFLGRVLLINVLMESLFV